MNLENRIVHSPLEIDPANVPSLYLCGIKKHPEHGDCPRQSITVGGFTFSLFSEEVTRIEGEPISRRTKRPGQLNWLTEAELDGLNKALKTKVFRGKRLLSKKGRNYRPHFKDIPVSAFLYIHKMDDDLSYRRPILDDTVMPGTKTDTTANISEAIVRNTDPLDEFRRARHSQLKNSPGFTV